MKRTTILVFDDKECEDIHTALSRACARFDPQILCALDVDAEPVPLSEVGRKRPERLATGKIASAPAVVVDLRMGFHFPPNDEEALLDQQTNYQGLYLIRVAEQLEKKVQGGCVSKLFVNSNYVKGLQANLPTTARAHSIIARALGCGLSVYQKQLPDYSDLCAKMYSLLDLRSRGYS